MGRKGRSPSAANAFRRTTADWADGRELPNEKDCARSIRAFEGTAAAGDSS